MGKQFPTFGRGGGLRRVASGEFEGDRILPERAVLGISATASIGRRICATANDSDEVDALRTLLTGPCGNRAQEVTKQLLGYFGRAASIVTSSPEELARALPRDPEAVHLLASVQRLLVSALRTEALGQETISSTEKLVSYLHLKISRLKDENIIIIFLDNRNRVLGEEITSSGSPKRAQISPRKILGLAFDLGATAIIIAHNHPSGDPHPSPHDIELTNNLIKIGNHVDLAVHDHLILARSGWTSLRASGLLAERPQ